MHVLGKTKFPQMSTTGRVASEAHRAGLMDILFRQAGFYMIQSRTA